MQRLRMGGNGSPRLDVTTCSEAIAELFAQDNNADRCHVELRPRGVIVRFRSLLETYALVIPFRSLALFKSGAGYTLYSDTHRIQFTGEPKGLQRFVRRVVQARAELSEV